MLENKQIVIIITKYKNKKSKNKYKEASRKNIEIVFGCLTYKFGGVTAKVLTQKKERKTKEESLKKVFSEIFYKEKSFVNYSYKILIANLE